MLLSLSTATENVNVAIEEHTVNIVDNDQPVPVYIIKKSQNDAEGVPDSQGELRGLVYGQNLRRRPAIHPGRQQGRHWGVRRSSNTLTVKATAST